MLNECYDIVPAAILPTSIEDNFAEDRIIAETVDKDNINYLFVGVAFFANVEGIEWFINNVLPYIPGKLTIVGNGMDKYKDTWESGRVSVFGYVEDLSKYYYEADAIVSPILSGGGMKTKTAEALMYGKTIFGTEEAFMGYKHDDRAMVHCDSAEDFIHNINQVIQKGDIHKYNGFSRSLFLRYYSYEATSNELHKFFKE